MGFQQKIRLRKLNLYDWSLKKFEKQVVFKEIIRKKVGSGYFLQIQGRDKFLFFYFFNKNCQGRGYFQGRAGYAKQTIFFWSKFKKKPKRKKNVR